MVLTLKNSAALLRKGTCPSLGRLGTGGKQRWKGHSSFPTYSALAHGDPAGSSGHSRNRVTFVGRGQENSKLTDYGTVSSGKDIPSTQEQAEPSTYGPPAIKKS